MDKAFFSTPELAQFLGVFHTTVRRWIERGQIKGVRVGRNYKIPPAEVIRVLDHCNIPLPEALRKHGDKSREAEGLWAQVKASGSILEKLLIVDEIDSPALLCRHDAIVAANQAFADLVGYSQADLIGLAITEVIDEQSEKGLMEIFQRESRDLEKRKLEFTAYWITPSMRKIKSRTAVGILNQVSDILLLVLTV